MGVKLVSSSGGSVEVNPPTTASNFTQTLVATTGTLAPIVSGTAVASTSGTSIDFTGIPSWVKRITVMFNGVSTNGTSNLLFQLGAGSATTSGYLGAGSQLSTSAVATTNYTTGFGMNISNAANVVHGSIIFTNVTGNSWASNGLFAASNGAATVAVAGSITLSGTLDRVRITTVNGTDTFDAGTINILYE